jgi:hypothetical protein
MANVVKKYIQSGIRPDTEGLIRNPDRLENVENEQDGKRFVRRTQCKGGCGKVFQAVGVALPPTLRQVDPAEA